ncbi:serine/threonine protein kinase [Exophiala dermatitidis]|uniref:non-specific serine/threonine protein kinase n=2 Tax=Exophiala dermatitidis TaxID=5970 RepID=H6BQI6_EXODN|nr:3-phosphoinositide dependent protein kinase-1 [Exophiala dermatitidis NIH/UT8656]KAJ4515833.1 serine/threonine protein kinase [Exophiala dermatitidis]EHY53803.1 3-phosphoinositide dependent protein kinase-1 [Exophiala dermatitidis NIH/UT8656]KAJ4519528.1 serine/threonine protein kinase [Exophiala dermatitidis]KAJ4529346.1 serine/threonine protein kinase [Exophiala dermatitidis]KAJ4544000.1 serine/threonine protein kinase [Exophiala dermatitidis]
MADLSLGPLRIANPDDAAPDTPLQPQPAVGTFPQISPMIDGNGRPDYLSVAPGRSYSPVSPLSSVMAEEVPSQAAAAASSDGFPSSTTPASNQNQRLPERPSQRQNIPPTYQDQQQAQFPQYPTMVPQNLHDSRSNAGRPGSVYYTQVPVNGASSNGVSRQGSYRVRSDGSASSGFPQRTSSKRSGMGDVAGVPSRDDTHTERAYGQGQYTTGNAPVPPRRTSRGVAGPRMGTTPTGTTPPSTSAKSSQNPLSTSPYNTEDRPLSSSEEWQERGAAVGIKREYDAEGRPVLKAVKKGVKDFNFGQTLGEGSYSTVLAATDRQSGKQYAIKVLDKRHIIKEKKVKYVNIEKDTLNRLTDHPGVVRLYYTFQDERSLYFVLDLCPGGELLGVLKRMSTFDEECTRFYGAQILDTIEYMHSRGVIHRDLKPENLLLDENMHIKVTDFGTAKLLPEKRTADGRIEFEPDSTSEENRANSFVGTAEYVSPELLTDKNACKASDLWAFGCIIYQLLAGRPPFKAGNDYQTFQKIVNLDYEFPRGFPEVARDLVERLLVLDPQRRLSLEHAKNHAFFAGIQWGRGLWQQKAPRLKPYVPPPQPPIKLNGNHAQNNYLPDVPSHSTHSTMLPPNNQKPHPRVITQLPPPSQLDIEWSPVLTRSNERILKLGNLSVVSSPNPHSPHGNEGGGKLARLFGGSNTKKRQRLVMVTSSARIIIAPAGGEEKKSKSEISLLAPGTEFSSATDSKGVTQWIVNTRDRHYVFEDPKPASNDPMATAVSAQEWLDALVRAREIATSMQNSSNTYSNDDTLNLSSSALSSHASTIDQSTDISPHSASHGHTGRMILHKQHSGGDTESLKGRKRFSKRQSKSGLTAVF